MSESKRIMLDKVASGSAVRIVMDGQPEVALFLGITGKGENREAIFVSPDRDMSALTGGTARTSYSWRAYRYNGRWAYGSSAERLVIEEVFEA